MQSLLLFIVFDIIKPLIMILIQTADRNRFLPLPLFPCWLVLVYDWFLIWILMKTKKKLDTKLSYNNFIFKLAFWIQMNKQNNKLFLNRSNKLTRYKKELWDYRKTNFIRLLTQHINIIFVILFYTWIDHIGLEVHLSHMI